MSLTSHAAKAREPALAKERSLPGSANRASPQKIPLIRSDATDSGHLDADARSKLDRLHEAIEAISTAYILKGRFRWLISYRRMGWAMRALEISCAMALVSGPAPFQRLQGPSGSKARRFLGS